jgi:hypothetical protein
MISCSRDSGECTVENRIDSLERSLRQVKVAVGIAAGLILVLGITALRPAPEGAEVLRVRGIVIVDAEGRERILIGAPIPTVGHRVRTDLERVRDLWAPRYPDPEQYMTHYRDYRHDTYGLLILDEGGFDRIAIGDPVPDPNVGKRIGPSTGMVINDERGSERSGYGLLNVDGKKRIVLGLDSDRGMEGLVLFLDDEGRVGIAISDGERGINMGLLPAGDPRIPGGERFSGLMFQEGQVVTRVIGSKEP